MLLLWEFCYLTRSVFIQGRGIFFFFLFFYFFYIFLFGCIFFIALANWTTWSLTKTFYSEKITLGLYVDLECTEEFRFLCWILFFIGYFYLFFVEFFFYRNFFEIRIDLLINLPYYWRISTKLIDFTFEFKFPVVLLIIL